MFFSACEPITFGMITDVRELINILCAPFDCLIPFKNGEEEQERFAQEHGSITYIIKHSIIRLRTYLV